MMDAILAHMMSELALDIPWRVVPMVFLGLIAVCGLFAGIYKVTGLFMD